MNKKERVLIVHLNQDDSQIVLDNKIKEIEELVRSSRAESVGVVIQNAQSINPSFFIGRGKAEEIAELVDSMDIDTLVVNHELTGSQMKNLEEMIDRKIVDRTGLILDIFARRAKTKEGKLEVSLAQLEYRLPRLVGFRNYLSREGGGIGTRGPGEQKLEVDRRRIQDNISRIKRQLEVVAGKRSLKRKRRQHSSLPIVSLVGYSNAGKSTILNALVERYGNDIKQVYSDDLLFATLDVSARQIKLPNSKDIIITDTVGFISDLPTKLVASFRSTLEEIEISDLILVVIDASVEDYQMQIDATIDVLKDMHLSDKKIMYIFNKMDLNPDFRNNTNEPNHFYMSAKNSSDIERLAEEISNVLFSDYRFYDIFVSYEELDSFMKKNLPIQSEEYKEEGLYAKLYIDRHDKKKYEEYMT